MEQLIDLHLTLRYFGVPIQAKSYVFGDIKTVVSSGTRTQPKLHKLHTALSFHWVTEAIAANIIVFYLISGEINPADILSMHWGYTQVCTMLQPLLFWQGDILSVSDKNGEHWTTTFVSNGDWQD